MSIGNIIEWNGTTAINVGPFSGYVAWSQGQYIGISADSGAITYNVLSGTYANLSTGHTGSSFWLFNSNDISGPIAGSDSGGVWSYNPSSGAVARYATSIPYLWGINANGVTIGGVGGYYNDVVVYSKGVTYDVSQETGGAVYGVWGSNINNFGQAVRYGYIGNSVGGHEILISPTTMGLTAPALSFIGAADQVTLGSAASIFQYALQPTSGIETIANFQYGLDQLDIDLLSAMTSMLQAHDTTLNGVHAISLYSSADPTHGVVLTSGGTSNFTTAADLLANHVTFSNGHALVS